MEPEQISHEALVCGHCGEKNRMILIAHVTDAIGPTDDTMGFQTGTRYEIQKCPRCNKIVLIEGDWNDAMEEPDEWVPKVLLPEPGDREARQLREELRQDREWMQRAVFEARKCPSEPSANPKVGAVVTRDGKLVAAGYRGEIEPGQHAEYTVLEMKCPDEPLSGATVYITLEPCTSRNFPKTPCAQLLADRKVARVVIGMLDPDVRIRGRGVLALRKANIRVDLFPLDLMTEVEEMNRKFIASRNSTDVEVKKGFVRSLLPRAWR